jgi:ferrous iron transport protein B
MDFMKEFKVGVLGAPNVGKTTLFNHLSGANEKVGNWPGTTVERKEAYIYHGDMKVTLVDVPGCYSLIPSSYDEKVASDFLYREKPDLVVVVANATNLYNTLYLAVEIIELGFKTIVVLNMFDKVKDKGIEIDIKKIEEKLGVRVIPAVGNKGIGVKEIRNEIIKALLDRNYKQKELNIPYVNPVSDAISEIEKIIVSKGYSDVFSLRGVAVKILEKDRHFISCYSPYLDVIGKVIDVAEKRLLNLSSDDVEVSIVRARYSFINQVLHESVKKVGTPRERIQKFVDDLLISRVWGLLIFLGVMFGVFNLIFIIGEPLANLIESLFSSLSAYISYLGETNGWNSLFVSFLTDGVISGVGSVLVFLPYIMVMFLFIGILEQSGFLARSAIMMDKIMSSFGLHGKSFVPMLLGFGCNVPAIIATRVLSSEKDRIITILVLPLITCPARLTVFVVFGAALFKNYQGLIIFIMYLLGIVLAGLAGIVFRKTIAKGEISVFVMELPDYHLPSLRLLLSEIWYRSFIFLKNAGTVIFSVVVFVWLMSSLPFGVEYASQDSLIGIIGRAMTPIFYFNGFGEHWQISVSLLTAILARETVISTLGTLYGVSEEGITNVIPHVFTPQMGLSFLIFMQVAMLCIATATVIKREIGLKWAIVGFFYTIILGWILSALVFQIGSLLF